MKRLLTISLLVLLLCASTAYSVKRTDAVDSRNDIERKIDAFLEAGSGTVWYVDSGASGGATGVDWTNAALTVEAAVALAAAEDTIFIGQGHNESLTTVDGVDLDKAGLYVKGFGRGTLMPTFDYDLALGEFVIGAANVRIENLRLRVSANVVSHAIDVETAGQNFEIVGCKFGYAETPADEFVTAIEVADTVSGGVIRGCRFDAGGQAAISAISTGTGNDLTIEDNFIFGDYSYACIENRLAANTMVIRRNTLFNGTMGGDGEINNVAAINCVNNTAGLVAYNTIISNALTGVLARVGDDMVFIHNDLTNTDGSAYSGGLESTAASITLSPAND